MITEIIIGIVGVSILTIFEKTLPIFEEWLKTTRLETWCRKHGMGSLTGEKE